MAKDRNGWSRCILELLSSIKLGCEVHAKKNRQMICGVTNYCAVSLGCTPGERHLQVSRITKKGACSKFHF